jgi:hypothetical protein
MLLCYNQLSLIQQVVRFKYMSFTINNLSRSIKRYSIDNLISQKLKFVGRYVKILIYGWPDTRLLFNPYQYYLT